MMWHARTSEMAKVRIASRPKFRRPELTLGATTSPVSIIAGAGIGSVLSRCDNPVERIEVLSTAFFTPAKRREIAGCACRVRASVELCPRLGAMLDKPAVG